MTTRWTAILVATLTVTVLIAGCGGDDENSGGDTQTVTASSLARAAFIKKARTICIDGAERAFEYQPSDPTEDVSFAKAIEVSVAPALQEAVDRLYELGAPEGDEAEMEAFLRAMQEGVNSLEEERASISSLQELGYPFRDASKLARKYGLVGCAYA